VRAPATAVAAVVLAAVIGGLVLLRAWPDDPAATPPAAGSSADASTLDVIGASADSVAAEVATAVLRAWSRPGLTYPWWWDGLRPLLSPGARAAYADTDPDQLPLLGDLRVVEERRAGRTATIWFRTDAGRFGVDLARAADGDWRAHRILFPGEESMFG
jgi:hypothetical protein